MTVRRLAEKQPPSFAFTPENLEWAKARIAKYPPGRQQSAVIPLLWRAQEQCGGWLPQKAIEATAELLGMAKIRVLEVATFYTMFNLVAGRPLPRPVLRHDAVHAARRGCAQESAASRRSATRTK